jgi:hypothetical protein
LAVGSVFTTGSGGSSSREFTASNFPVNFGDTVNGLICLQSATEASANLVNVTTGLSVSFDFSAPSGMASDDEDQVEWIMELPGYSGANPQLPNFGEIYFDSALGGGGLDLVVNAGTDTVLNLGASNAIVATTTVETPTLIKIAYVPLTMTIEVTAPSFPGSIGVGDTETGELVISATFKAVVTFLRHRLKDRFIGPQETIPSASMRRFQFPYPLRPARRARSLKSWN